MFNNCTRYLCEVLPIDHYKPRTSSGIKAPPCASEKDTGVSSLVLRKLSLAVSWQLEDWPFRHGRVKARTPEQKPHSHRKYIRWLGASAAVLSDLFVQANSGSSRQGAEMTTKSSSSKMLWPAYFMGLVCNNWVCIPICHLGWWLREEHWICMDGCMVFILQPWDECTILGACVTCNVRERTKSSTMFQWRGLPSLLTIEGQIGWRALQQMSHSLVNQQLTWPSSGLHWLNHELSYLFFLGLYQDPPQTLMLLSCWESCLRCLHS